MLLLLARSHLDLAVRPDYPEFMKEPDKCLDSQLWHACAGGMVQMPALNSLVYYFPQGHAEHAQGYVDFGNCPRLPPYILCRLIAIKYMADSETDEVFAKMKLLPLRPNELDYNREEMALPGNGGSDMPEKPASFAKTLTQSDANNGGGFSVPRYCAETIFPRLDYSADPPVQTVLAKDVHGETWKFRHIYRGTPRRHLLTTGWSAFVNQKKLVAGDSIVFLRTDNGELCVGIRRAKRRIGAELEPPLGWNLPAGNCFASCPGFSVFPREDNNKLIGGNGYGGNPSSGGVAGLRGKVMPDSVILAATFAATGQPFEVVYYPRASTPEFCVKAAAVRTALRIKWCPGMRFKMAFETEDSSRISWFMGTISSVQYSDPISWPDSPWRLLQVSWDEPDLLQNVKCVSPWLVELVSNMPSVNLMPFSPPRKKLRLPQGPDFSFDSQLPTPLFTGNPLRPSSSPLCSLPDSTPAGIQGARHAQFGLPLPELHVHKLHQGLLQTGFHPLEYTATRCRSSTDLIIGNPTIEKNVSCLLNCNSSSTKKPNDAKTPQFLLFGQPILTEQQISMSTCDTTSSQRTRNGSPYENPDKTTNLSDGSGTAFHHGPADNSSCEGLFWCKDRWETHASIETGHCKVFMESDNVGRTLDLSYLGSYEELYTRLADMFGIEKFDMKNHVLFQDSTGAIKHSGDEPFGIFVKTARRLQILVDSGSDNVGR